MSFHVKDDKNRVVLPSEDGSTDYINASFVQVSFVSFNISLSFEKALSHYSVEAPYACLRTTKLANTLVIS